MRFLRHAVNQIGEDAFPGLFRVKRADIMAQSDYMRREKLSGLERWQELYQKLLEEKQCVSLRTLAVSGADLIGLGMDPGRKLGETLQKLLELVLEEPERNSREFLLARAEEMLSQG